MNAKYKRREIALYRKRAHDYDGPGDNASLRGNEVCLRLLSNFASHFRDASILDLGCGTGRTFVAVQNCGIVGIDLSLEMLQIAKSRLASGPRNVDLIRADIFNLPLREDRGTFDAIISIGVVGVHVPLTESLLSRLHSLLKSDSGRLMFATNTMRRHWRKILTRKTYELLRKSPESRLLIWDFPVQPYAEVMWMLRRKLKRAGYVLEKVEKAKFADEAHVVTAGLSTACET